MTVYFDNAATTRVCPEAVRQMNHVMETAYGNPSSLHRMGMESEKEMQHARRTVAAALCCAPECIYFTSGGTESDNIAVIGGTLRNARGRKTVIISEAEHPGVSSAARALSGMGYQLQTVRLHSNGLIDLAHLEQLVCEDTVLVSIMQVNNETGCIMPLKEAIAIVRKKAPRALFHSDMVQSFGKTTMEDVDLASVSSHKIHGPKGVGALYIKKGVHVNPLLYGGGQEGEMRPGTENVPGIAGFRSAAALLRPQENNAYVGRLKDRLVALLAENIENYCMNGENTVPHILNISFAGAKSEVLLHMLESKGIMVSSGSACSSNKPAPSPVLTAMGLKRELVDCAVRFSFSEYNTMEEIEYCANVLKQELPMLRRMMR